MSHGLAASGLSLAAALASRCEVRPVFTIGRLHAVRAPQPVRTHHRPRMQLLLGLSLHYPRPYR